jgi:hypothetical protein
MINPIIQEIEAFCLAHDMTESTFGRLALKDWKFVKELRGSEDRKPRRLWPETEQTLRHFMATYRPKTADQQRANAA